MTMIERLNFRRKLALGLCLAIGATGCSDPNKSGEGNEFSVRGIVIDAGDESLKAEVLSITVASGEADKKLEIGEVQQFHDNCECHGFWDGKKQYGQVYDYAGEAISPSEVEEGACVDLEGKAREESHMVGKVVTYEHHLVYDEARIVPCG